MNRINEAFAELKRVGKKGFIPYITAGYPDIQTTEKIILDLAGRGVTAIELGVPFSDPIADGPTIQNSIHHALQNHVNLKKILAMVRKIRKECAVPTIIFTYLNPVYRMGLENFAYAAKEAGVSGVLILDLPFEERAACIDGKAFSGLALISLVAPTTSKERLSVICRHGEGFIYAISRLGVTGADKALSDHAERMVQEIKKHTDLPVALGFGVSSAEQVKEVAAYADAVVVGSAIVNAIKTAVEKNLPREEIVEAAGHFVSNLMKGL